jgi:15-cis-phytoene desaturase
MSQHVIVLGGGVAGMSAAHELVERGFQVTVYEMGKDPGGKARSFDVNGTGTNGRFDLPAEHGFRFFPGFYKHLPDTMKRIPYGRNAEGVFGNLVNATQMQIIFEKKPHIIVPARFPRSLDDVRTVLGAAGLLTTATGLTPADIEFYAERVWQLLTSCEERRAEQLENLSWWAFIDAANRSPVYQAFLGRTPRVLVAANPMVANTKTIGDVLLQLLFNLTEPGVAADRVLNGPTSDVWITPWLKHLRDSRVAFYRNAPVTGFECSNAGRISAVRVYQDGRERRQTADYYVAALPVERMADLITPDMLKLDPTLAGIQTLADHVDWMNGIQFYLRTEVPLVYGHQMCLGSDWALTSLSQVQFWSGPTDFARDYGDGTVRTVLSVDVSDWKNPATDRNSPVYGRAAWQCTINEVADEVWRQLKTALPEHLTDGDRHPTTPWHLDPAIQPANGPLTNAEPLLVNRTNSWALRPWARTRIPNLFLASDYVRTYTNLATMEAANEAARRAVNAILDESGVRMPPCRLWALHEPAWVKPWRWWDLYRYRNGLPWAAEFPDFVQGSAQAVLGAAPAIGGSEEYADATARQVAENGVGIVPSYVQNEVADIALDLGSALERGDVAMLRGLVVPGAQIVREDGERVDITAWIDDLAKGGRIEFDVRSLEEVRPDGRGIVARFAVDLTLGADVQRRAGRRRRLEVALSPSADREAKPGPRPWLIQGLRYTV